MTHHRHHRIIAGMLALSGLCLGLALDAPPAQANDDKIFSPQICLPLGGGDDFSHARYSIAKVEQIETGNIFSCPLMRDVISGQLDDVWVRVHNVDPDDPTSPVCCVHSISVDANLQDFECKATNTIGLTSLRLTLDDFSEFQFGDYVVTCDLGVGDAISSIRMSEKS